MRKIDAHSYKAFMESLRGDILIKIINLILRSAECRLKYLSGYLSFLQMVKYLTFLNFFSMEFCHNLFKTAISFFSFF